jgi:hypothetical protein
MTKLDPKLVYETLCLWDKGPLSATDITAKVYGSIHSVPIIVKYKFSLKITKICKILKI